MSKNFILGILGIIAIISGAIITLVLLKNKFEKRREFDFDDFDDALSDDEFEHFFDTDDDFMDDFDNEDDSEIAKNK